MADAIGVLPKRVPHTRLVPAGIPVLNRAHPFVRRAALLFAWTNSGDNTPRDLTRKHTPEITITTSLNAVVTQFGHTASFTLTRIRWGTDRDIDFSVDKAWTAWTVVKFDVFTGDQRTLMTRTPTSGAVQMLWNAHTDGKVRINPADSGDSSTVVALSIDRWYFAALSHNGNGNRNGITSHVYTFPEGSLVEVFSFSSAALTDLADIATQNTTLGSRNAAPGNDDFNGQLLMGGFVQEEHSVAEIQAVARRPFGVFAPQLRLIPTGIAAAGGAEEFIGRQYPQGVNRGVMRGVA